MRKTVAYLDILGFGDYTKSNIEEALGLLFNYQTIVNQKIIDNKLYPPTSYPCDLRELAKQNMVDSFEYFLPFSDSLFIQSSAPNDFLKQISGFLLGCFLFTSDKYANPEDPSDPLKVTIREIGLRQKGVIKKCKISRWPPVLFRGGISHGDTYVFDVYAIVDSDLAQIKNIAGRALVNAVKELEPLGKGPRLFCDTAFYNQLDNSTKAYCKKLSGKHHEILWPAFHFIVGNDVHTESNKICDLVRPVANLWKAYNHLPFGIHYFEFLRLIISASLTFFDMQGKRQIAEDAISKCLKSVGLENKEETLKRASGNTAQINRGPLCIDHGTEFTPFP